MRHVLQRLARGLSRRLLRMELRGWENYPHDKQRLLIVANHTAYLDGALLAAFLTDVPIGARVERYPARSGPAALSTGSWSSP